MKPDSNAQSLTSEQIEANRASFMAIIGNFRLDGYSPSPADLEHFDLIARGVITHEHAIAGLVREAHAEAEKSGA